MTEDPRVEAVAEAIWSMNDFRLGRTWLVFGEDWPKRADEHRRAAAELLAAADAAAWRPIETAPKPPLSDSGPDRYILGYCPPEHEHDRVRVVWWEPKVHGGMWQDDRDLDKIGGPKPTHWQPLPMPPPDRSEPPTVERCPLPRGMQPHGDGWKAVKEVDDMVVWGRRP